MLISSTYYLYLSVAFLAVAIYNLHISNQGKLVQCYNLKQLNFTEFNNYFNSKGLISINKTDNSYNALQNLNLVYPINNFDSIIINKYILYKVALEEPNIYSTLQELIAVFYIILLFISLTMSIVTLKLSNMVPDDFLDMSRFKRIGACFCKIFPLILIILHFVISLLLIIVWGLYGSSYCSTSASILPGTLINRDKYYIDIFTLNLVTTVIWFCIHYIGSIFKEILYEEPYMYNTWGNKKNVSYYLFKKLGP